MINKLHLRECFLTVHSGQAYSLVGDKSPRNLFHGDTLASGTASAVLGLPQTAFEPCVNELMILKSLGLFYFGDNICICDL